MAGQSHNDQQDKRTKAAEVLNSFVHKVESGVGSKEGLFHEIEALQRVINDARRDLGKTGAASISSHHIPTATDELDAIVESTALATGDIMDACEEIEHCLAGLEDEKVQKALEIVTKIYEACSFQDITGQRISKIVQALHAIETKVSDILKVLSRSLPGIEYAEEVDLREGDAALLNGPQLKDKAISQAEIDALLDDLFDE